MMEYGLEQIFNKYQSDKSHKHQYHHIYESVFAEHRLRPLNLLEIGIFQGASILSWAEYFPNACIFGVDIDLKLILPGNGEQITANPRINVRASDSRSRVDFGGILFDFIIDDGDHSFNSQIETFKNYFPLLKKGGFYFIEDVYFGADYLQQEGLRVKNDKTAIAGFLNFFGDYQTEYCVGASNEPDSMIVKIIKSD